MEELKMNQLKEIKGMKDGKEQVIMYSTNIEMKANSRSKKSLGKLFIPASHKETIDLIRMLNKDNKEVIEMNMDGSMAVRPWVKKDDIL
jgi:hypothetical protein